MPKKWMQEKSEMEKTLKEMPFGFLGMSLEDKPYVIPMTFAYQEDKIFLHAALKGLKLEYIKNNPQVCFTVAEQQQLVVNNDPCDYAVRYRSVIARGKAKLLEDPDEKITALQTIASKYCKDATVPRIEKKKVQAVNVIVIEIEEMTGKYNVQQEA